MFPKSNNYKYYYNLGSKVKNFNAMYDRVLLWLTIGLITIGFVMVTSSSIAIGQRLTNDPFLFAKQDILYIIFICFLAIITLNVPTEYWQYHSAKMLIISIIMLVFVLLIGSPVNGAIRWISLGKMHIQPSELTKLTFFCYLSNYIVRKIDEVRNNLRGLLKPISIIFMITILLLAQSDFGTIIVLLITSLATLFLAGAKLGKLIIIINLSIFTILPLIFIKSYRIQRILSFWNPWEDPYGKGYQLTQSLMAFGRGKFWGEGLGNSIQKLEYLPKAHTDFIFSIIGEELGYIGVVLSLLMIFLIALRAMLISRKAIKINYYYSGFLACSIGIWFSFQTFINVGTTVGILPTKGLTLPFISYGGSSLLTMSIAVMILLRIDHEVRLKQSQAFLRSLK